MFIKKGQKLNIQGGRGKGNYKGEAIADFDTEKDEQIKTYYTACQYIINHYGREKQKQQLVQELAELIVAITKNDIENIIEEMADVQVMLDQFTVSDPALFDKIELMQIKKVKRQIGRIQEENEKCLIKEK